MQGKKWRTPERERQVIDLYLQYHSVPKVAKMVDCGRTTIQTILKENGIPQDGKRGRKPKPKPEPKVKKSHCRSKYCPALIAMLHKAFGWNAKGIAEATGYAENGVRKVLKKRGFVADKTYISKTDCDLNQIEREYLAGTTSHELGERYGVAPATISKWMRQRGINLGKGNHQKSKGRLNGDGNKANEERHQSGEIEFAARLSEQTNGRFEFAGNFRVDGNRGADVRCTVCGYTHHRFELSRLNLMKCPECVRRKRERREQERDGMRYERMFAEIREYAVEKTCAECGSKFQSVSPSAKYCCKACSRRAQDRRKVRTGAALADHRHYYHVKYGDAYRRHYDPTVTLRALYERDGGVCQICGGPCDWNDKEWGANGPTYPSIDHIVPRAQGGDHFWSNVQLAHCLCNSRKRDLPDEVAKSEVVTVAKAS